MIRRSTTVPRSLSLSRRFIVVVAVCAWTFGTAPLAAQQPAQTPAPPPPPPPPRIDVTVTVIGATPLPGIGVTLDQVPAPVQTATAADLRKDGSLDVSSFLNNRLSAVHVNNVQGNPFQADVSRSASWFRAENQDDILFVASTQSGFGYFKNFGRTRREGVELNATLRRGRIEGGGEFPVPQATFFAPGPPTLIWTGVRLTM